MILSLCTFLSLCALSTQTIATGTQCSVPKCKRNEELIRNAPFCSTEPTCSWVLWGIPKLCGVPPLNYQCKPRCECKPGFVRINGECVPVRNCCTGPNEVITNCPACCDETCAGKPSAGCKLIPCYEKGCRCRNGYVRNANGICIRRCECPRK